ncbi:hypothetical protein QEW_0397 [Clostridioides difficile CD160]|nr:hypothetical protein QEW_0397 [Clostridioides difficile CD160]
MEENMKSLIEHSENIKNLKESMESTIDELINLNVGSSGIDVYRKIMQEEIHEETINVCKDSKEIISIKKREEEQMLKDIEKNESKIEDFFKKIGFGNK